MTLTAAKSNTLTGSCDLSTDVQFSIDMMFQRKYSDIIIVSHHDSDRRGATLIKGPADFQLSDYPRRCDALHVLRCNLSSQFYSMKIVEEMYRIRTRYYQGRRDRKNDRLRCIRISWKHCPRFQPLSNGPSGSENACWLAKTGILVHCVTPATITESTGIHQTAPNKDANGRILRLQCIGDYPSTAHHEVAAAWRG